MTDLTQVADLDVRKAYPSMEIESTGENNAGESESNWTFSSATVLATARSFFKHAESKLEHLLDEAVESAKSEAEVIDKLLLAAMDHATEAILGRPVHEQPTEPTEVESTGEDTLGS